MNMNDPHIQKAFDWLAMEIRHTMIRIEVKKLGTVLSSRPAGREALLAIKSSILRDAKKTETVELDFAGVDALAPSWADEFVTPLTAEFEERSRSKVIIY
jgi:hypothetical protein